MPNTTSPGSALIVGASRGLGLALAAELASRGWGVVGTVRADATPLHDLARRHPDRVSVETLDIDAQDAIAGLAERLSGRRLDVLFVNAGTTAHEEHIRVGAVETEEFIRVMLTNVLGPMRVVEALARKIHSWGGGCSLTRWASLGFGC